MRNRAFTVVELIVALGVASLMMFMIVTIFSTTANAVSRGIAVSDWVQIARAVSPAMEADFKHQRAPSDGGVLVILNKRYAARPFDFVRQNRADNDDSVRDVRSDQVWFLGAVPDGIRPVVHRDPAWIPAPTYTECRIWYGHVTQAMEDGSESPTPMEDARPANTWMLGRQTLILCGAEPTLQYAATPNATATVTGSDYPSVPLLYHGMVDACAGSIADLTGAGGVLDGLTDPLYRGVAYTLGFGDHRLMVQLQPSLNADWPLFQMHTLHAERISDFIVEFAADTDITDTDTGPDLDVNGNIRWYGMDDTPTWTGTTDPRDAAPGLAHADEGFVWRHDVPDNWPMLLRIRWRYHDRRGDLAQEGERGLWVEQMVAIKR